MALIRKDVTRALGISESSKSFSIIKIDENQYKKRFRKIITGNNANYQSSLNPEILRQGKIYPELIQCKKSKVMNRVFMTHLFRSLCPVTGQPDWATVYIRYSGNLILENTLFDYLLTYRNHPDFHEHCCERIFSDISNQAKPQSLLVSCHFTRRGGIDINPIRHSLGIQIKWNKIWESHYRQ
jgi:NADPH-dependent 7-cyano-7-deazaguanine reductase QueF